MSKKLFLLVVVFIGFNCYSQTSFESGYFITNDDQKIIGNIKNIDWRNNPTDFEYTLQDDAVVLQTTIMAVKEFGIANGSKFIRRTVDIDRSLEQLSVISIDKNPVFNKEQLFLRVLIEGDANLYEYRGDGGLRRYFYSKGDDEIKQLVYKTYEHKNEVMRNTYYQQQLWNDLKCEGITLQKIENTDYTKNELEKFFTAYNKCTNNDYVVVEKKKKYDAFDLSVRARVNSTSVSLDYDAYEDRSMDFGNSVAIAFGIEAEYILGFNNNKWGVLVEPTYVKYENTNTVSSSSVAGGTQTGTIDYSALEVPFGVRHYFFLNDSSKLFVNALVIYDLPSKSTITLTRTDGSIINKFKINTTPNAAFGAGFKFKDKFIAELRYHTSRQLLSGYNNLSATYDVASLVIGYTIF